MNIQLLARNCKHHPWISVLKLIQLPREIQTQTFTLTTLSLLSHSSSVHPNLWWAPAWSGLRLHLLLKVCMRLVVQSVETSISRNTEILEILSHPCKLWCNRSIFSYLLICLHQENNNALLLRPFRINSSNHFFTVSSHYNFKLISFLLMTAQASREFIILASSRWLFYQKSWHGLNDSGSLQPGLCATLHQGYARARAKPSQSMDESATATASVGHADVRNISGW